MLRKLLKYDLRSTLRRFAVIWCAVLAAALLERLLLPKEDLLSASGTGSGLVSVFSLILVAMLVLSVVHIVRRFYRGLLGDEGYLMHTLPVEPWLLVMSKLLCAMLVLSVSVLVAVATYYLLFSRVLELSALNSSAVLSSETLTADRPVTLASLSVWAALLIDLLCRAARTVLTLYLAMTLGHLVHRHPVAASAAIWVGLGALVSAATGYAKRLPVRVVYSGEEPSMAAQLRMTLRQSFLRSAVLDLFLAALFLLIISRVLTYKLELE